MITDGHSLESQLGFGITYLNTDVHFPEEDKFYLLGQATEMYLNKEEKRIVRGESFSGAIKTTGDYFTLGTYSGQFFEAKLDSDFGKTEVSFLVNEFSYKGAFTYKKNKGPDPRFN